MSKWERSGEQVGDQVSESERSGEQVGEIRCLTCCVVGRECQPTSQLRSHRVLFYLNTNMRRGVNTNVRRDVEQVGCSQQEIWITVFCYLFLLD